MWDVIDTSWQMTLESQQPKDGRPAVARCLFPSLREISVLGTGSLSLSCGSYRSRAILGSNILAVFHVISAAWGRGKGLTLSINHFFFPPPICSVILSLLHTPLISDHFISVSGSPPPCCFLSLCPLCSHLLAEMLPGDLILSPSSP